MNYPLNCPTDIEVLLHCHMIPAAHPRRAAPAVAEAIEEFVKRGLIIANPPHGYRTTDKGDALIDMLLLTPEPDQVWADPRTGERVTLCKSSSLTQT